MSIKKKSKFLSLVLRHKPEEIGITLDEAGWVGVKTLLDALRLHGRGMTLSQLKDVVENNDKKRFAFSEDGKKIRANQGHSVKIELGYTEQAPPGQLYHGTAERFLDAIKAEGLKKMSRHHVHLSDKSQTALKVGQRHGKPIILVIESWAMYNAGHKFYLSENGVWLTDHVPPEFIINW